MTDERIGTGFDEPGLENGATSDRNRNGLYSLERVGKRPIQIRTIEDRAHDMERRKPIRSGVHHIESQPLTDVHGDGVLRVFRRPAVEHDVVGGQTQQLLPVDRARRVSESFGIELTLHEHEFLCRRASLPRIDDDRPVHPVCDVQRHRGGAAMVHERPRDTRHEPVMN